MAVGKSADALAASFRKLHKKAEEDWAAHRTQMQEDFKRVDEFVTWGETETAKAWQENFNATRNCALAVKACNELVNKLDKPVEESINSLNKVKSHGFTIITNAAENTYKRLRQPVLKRATILLAAAIFIQLGVGAFTLWRNRHLIDTNWQELAEQSEQQKTELKGMIDKTFEEVKATQIGNEIKVQMWDELIQSLPADQRSQVIYKFRGLVRQAGDKRLDDQMVAGYEQMSPKKK